MKIHIIAIGRMKAGPEQELLSRYIGRLVNMGHARGLTDVVMREFAESAGKDAAGRKRKEAQNLIAALPKGAVMVALDEGGDSLPSWKFATRIGRWADQGIQNLAFVLGGADGLDRQILVKAQSLLALGPMTWPHQIARILLAEQLYRAMAILSGHPYHRS